MKNAKKKLLVQVVKFLWSKAQTHHFSFKDWKAIVVCFGISIFFWVFTKLNGNYATNVKIPLHFEYAHENIIVTQPLPSFIQANISGMGYELLKTSIFSTQPIDIKIQRPLDSKYQTIKSIRPQLDEVLKNFEINYVVEDTLYTHFDTIVSKKLYIAIDSASIPLEENYKITSAIRLEPDSVLVVGTREAIQNQKDTAWVVLEEDNIDSSFEEMVKPQINLQDYQSLVPAEIKVFFDVAYFYHLEAPARLHFVNFPEDQNFDIIPKEARVMYSIRKDIYDDYETLDSIEVYLDFLEYNKADSTICASYDMQNTYEEIQSIPENFIIIPKKNAESRINWRNRRR